MKRLKVTDEEADIIKGLRNERAIYNGAIEDAIKAIDTNANAEEARNYASDFIQVLMKLRKEGLP